MIFSEHFWHPSGTDSSEIEFMNNLWYLSNIHFLKILKLLKKKRWFIIKYQLIGLNKYSLIIKMFFQLRTSPQCWFCRPCRLFLLGSIWIISQSQEPSTGGVRPWCQGGRSRHRSTCMLLTVSSQFLAWEQRCLSSEEMTHAGVKKCRNFNFYNAYRGCAPRIRRWHKLLPEKRLRRQLIFEAD